MRPEGLKTRIFLDSGDPNETREAIKLLGFLDGQTTNPSLIAKNPEAQGKKFTKEEINLLYRGVVMGISELIPAGSVSVEVYADRDSTPDDLLRQGQEMFLWIPNAHIKYPIISAGMEAAQRSVEAGMRINMTLCFDQEQAAAVYAATLGAKKGDVFVSPFVGRLDDKGKNGMDLIINIHSMYQVGDGHTEVLSASVRNVKHLLYSIAIGCDIVTAPYKVLKEWKDTGMLIPGKSYVYDSAGLESIPYEKIDLGKPWQRYNIVHELTDAGTDRFAKDWNSLIK